MSLSTLFQDTTGDQSLHQHILSSRRRDRTRHRHHRLGEGAGVEDLDGDAGDFEGLLRRPVVGVGGVAADEAVRSGDVLC